MLVLLSDGLVEARRGDLDDSVVRFERGARAVPGHRAGWGCDLVLEQMLDDGQEDDVMLLVVVVDRASAG